MNFALVAVEKILKGDVDIDGYRVPGTHIIKFEISVQKM